MKPRHHLYLDQALSDQLEALAARPGSSKSAIVADALRSEFGRQGRHEADALFGARLDRISRQLGRIERDGHVLLESLALFVRYQLMVTAPLPEADAAGRAIGRERFEAFVTQVGRQLGSGKRTLGSGEEPL